MTNRNATRDDSTLFRLDDLVEIAKSPQSKPLGEPLLVAPTLTAPTDLTPTPAVLAPAAPKRSHHRVAALVGGFAVVSIATTALAAAVVIKYSQPQPQAMIAKVSSDISKPMFVTMPRAPASAVAAQVVVPTVEREVAEPKSKSRSIPVAKLPAIPVAKRRAIAVAKLPAIAAKRPANTKSKGGDSELNTLINSIGAPGDGKREATKTKAASKLPKTLERSQIQRVMRTQVFGAVSRCYERFHVPGFVHTKITISRDGKALAHIRGRFARTPTGSCVADAVRRASFPPFSGAPISVSYPFRLR